MTRPEENHASRPAVLYYALNRRFRVVQRFGVYTVQRRKQDPFGKNTWRYFVPVMPKLEEAIEVCGVWAQPLFIEGIGWT